MSNKEKEYDFGAYKLVLKEDALVLSNVTSDITVSWNFTGEGAMGMHYNLCKMLDESNGEGEWNEPQLAKEYLKMYFAMLWHSLSILPDGEFFADWAQAVGAFYERNGANVPKEDITDTEMEQLLAIEHAKQELVSDTDRLVDEALKEIEDNKKKGIA